jgi:hypothetical protein
VQAARSRGHREAGQPELGEQRAELARPGPDRGEVGGGVPVRRIEVEHQAVRMVGPVGAAGPRVRGDAVQVGEPDKRRRLAPDRVADVAAAAPRHAHATYPVRRAARDLLLDHDVVLDPAVPAPEVQRPVADVRRHHGGDVRVVGRQLGLADAVGGEEELVRAADAHPPPAGAHARLGATHVPDSCKP